MDIVASNNEALDYDVVYTNDDEGQSFYYLNIRHEIGHYDLERYWFKEESDKSKYNAICIN